jgi:phage gp29-like protein
LEDGEYSGKIGLTKLKTLDPENIEFKTDKYGNLTNVIQKSMGEKGQDIDIPLNKAIIYTENKQFGNHYGKSRLRAVYKNWFIKDMLTKFWNIYLERFGMPLVMGTVPNKTFMEKMKDILENIQSRSSIVKTQGWEIEMLESKKSGSSVSEYKIAIDYQNAEIMKGLLVPSLMLEVGKSGSYALGQTQFDIFALMLKNLENDITSLVEKYIIQPMVEYNFGKKDQYPEFKLEPLTKTDLLNLSKVFALLVKNGIVGSDETFMRDMMNIPHREDVLIEESSGAKIPKTGIPPKPLLPANGSQQVKVPTDRTPR